MLLADRKSTVAWCRKHVSLDYGVFDPARHYGLMAEPLDYMDRYPGHICGLMGSVQSVKTLAIELKTLRDMQVDPARVGFYCASEEAVKDITQKKFNALRDFTAPIVDLRDSLGNRAMYAATGQQFLHPSGPVQFLNAGVKRTRNSLTLQKIRLDEPWMYEPSWIEQIKGRATAFPWQWEMQLATSAPTIGSETHRLYLDSDQRTRHYHCPHCGELFNNIFRHNNGEWSILPEAGADGTIPAGGLRFDTSDAVKNPDDSLNKGKFLASVYFQCPHCAAAMRYSTGLVAKLNESAVWVPLNPDPDPKIHFWHWNYFCHVDWAEIAWLYVRACRAKNRGDVSHLEEVYRKRFAIPWSNAITDKPEAAGVFRGTYDCARLDAPFRLASWWSEAIYHFMTVDVQQDHFWAVVRAWGSDESRLIWAGRILTAGALKDVQKHFQIPDHGGMLMEAPCGVFLDGNYNTETVRRICAEMHWHILRGRDEERDFKHEDGLRRLFAEPIYINPFEGTGKSNRGMVTETYFAKAGARNRLALLRSITDPRRIWTVGRDVPETYLHQIDSWVRIAKRRATDDSYRYIWYNTRTEDHLYDCECMQVIVASMCGLVGAESMEIDAASEKSNEARAVD